MADVAVVQDVPSSLVDKSKPPVTAPAIADKNKQRKRTDKDEVDPSVEKADFDEPSKCVCCGQKFAKGAKFVMCLRCQQYVHIECRINQFGLDFGKLPPGKQGATEVAFCSKNCVAPPASSSTVSPKKKKPRSNKK